MSALDIEAAARVLRDGGLVAFPTETFYGLAALASDTRALARLAALKGRDAQKPIALIAADAEQAESLWRLPVPSQAGSLIARYWPGALTIVCASADHVDALLTGALSEVGVRVPAHPMARKLARLAGGPITATSANFAGEPPVTRVADLPAALVAQIDLVLDGGETPGGAPSTLVAVRGDQLIVLRAGAVNVRG